ncbi:MAG: dihydropyrimidinase [Opitutaceae bacterium]
MALLIRHGEVVTAGGRGVADVYCEGETVTAIGRDLPAPAGATVIDATGHHVFPGFIDPHVHIHLPFMGTLAKDTYTTGSRAALMGGTTTLIEMCCPARQDDALAAFEHWLGNAEGKSACDFTFHMGVTRFDDGTPAKLREIVRRGVASFKIFLAYRGAFGIDDRELYRTLKLAKELGVIVAVHCENETLVAERQQELLAAGMTDPGRHHESRPPFVEAEGVHHLMSFAEATGADTYIVHLSCAEALDAALAARRRGVRVAVETLIQYLVLDRSYAERPGFEGAKFVMSPPLRDARNQAVLWDGLRSRLIDTVATDHAPFDFRGQKEMGREDFTKIPNGIPALEERINLLHTHGVRKGRLDLCDLVDAASTRVAKLFDLFPRKGTIAVGADADLVVFDPKWRGVISARTQAMNVDYSAFEGWPIEGRPRHVAVRGQLAVRNFEYAGTPGRGKFLARTPSHF